ncbi:Phosphatidylinositol 3-kinase VPS34 [Camellia lanceoleosa]|uniref:Phosphatidylinositol 3-kinase VPS34 n=1 Tax=Camellia lanceoleosa TaxID=1840588 RepID=A0ACC0I2J9_9ERIC|nr:Phosphatidylinositol 3-kinase VPS34 [Camellia lanceoleosa]
MFLSREIGDGKIGKISEIGKIWEEGEDSGGTAATAISEIEDRHDRRRERTSEKLLRPTSLQEKFRLDLDDKECIHFFQDLINKSVKALFPQIHRWAQYCR